MKANITKDFVILVEVKDSCEYSATATVSIETQNMVKCNLLFMWKLKEHKRAIV
jgi:hypothetical protein